MPKQQLPKEVLTTPQVAELIGVKEGTVRSWLSRYTCFVEGHHYIKEESGRTLWLAAGVEFLKTRATEFATDNATETVAPDLIRDEVLDSLLDTTAQQLAYLYFEKLPERTVQRIRQILQQPTQEDRAVLQKSMQRAIEAGATHLINHSTVRRLPG